MEVCPSSQRMSSHFKGAEASAAILFLIAVLLGACGATPIDPLSEQQDALTRLPPGDGDPPAVDCLGSATATLTGPSGAIQLWQTATLTWSVQGGCSLMKLTLAGVPVARQGSLVVQPIANTPYTLRATLGTASRSLATVGVLVQLPPIVTITANHWIPLLLQALDTENTTVQITNDVEMDLSGEAFIRVKPGVSLIGGRNSRDQGARLYTNSHPPVLFDLRGDGVHISGLRIQAPDTEFGGRCTGHDSAGIALDTDPRGGFMLGSGRTSMAQVLIDNNELSGWSQAAVRIHDYGNLIDQASGLTRVVVRGNYIHNNQRQLEGDCGGDTDGYGVDVSHGAYALVEQNVFEWNRHDIASDGSDGSGYFAYSNLVLEGGGLSFVELGIPFYTHAFDMHGQGNCGLFSDDNTWNCGPAGEYVDIRHNTFLFKNGNAFHLRGTPRASAATPGLRVGADVSSNAFAHQLLFDFYFPPYGPFFVGALRQNESGLNQWDNGVQMNLSPGYGHCDFDGDGISDVFFATGETWWFSSAGIRPWTYLNTSRLRLSDVTLGDFDHDGYCDALAGGVLYSRGRGR